MSEATVARLADNERHWPTMAEDLLEEVNEPAWDYEREEEEVTSEMLQTLAELLGEQEPLCGCGNRLQYWGEKENGECGGCDERRGQGEFDE